MVRMKVDSGVGQREECKWGKDDILCNSQIKIVFHLLPLSGQPIPLQHKSSTSTEVFISVCQHLDFLNLSFSCCPSAWLGQLPPALPDNELAPPGSLFIPSATFDLSRASHPTATFTTTSGSSFRSFWAPLPHFPPKFPSASCISLRNSKFQPECSVPPRNECLFA